MIRFTLLYITLVALWGLAAWRWFWGLCGLLFLAVLNQHPSMPSYMLGVQGLNPFNISLAVVAMFWLIQRRAEPQPAPAPLWLPAMLVAYVLLVALSAIGAALNMETLSAMFGGKTALQWMIVDGMINPLKYVLIGVMFFDGARSRQRVKLALFSVVGSGMCYALLMYKSLNVQMLSINFQDARRLTDKVIGLFANDLAEVLAFTFWAAVFLYALFDRRWQKLLWGAAIALIIPPFIVLKSRAGLLALSAAAAVFGVLRWRRVLLLFPIAAVLVLYVAPGLQQRLRMGFEDDEPDWGTVSAGRLTNIWPPVIEQITKSPLLGHGRYAIIREKCGMEILELEGTLPVHPHNSYLEILLDAGLIGLLVCMIWMAVLGYVGVTLLRERKDPLLRALGGVTLAAIVTELAAGVAGSSFYTSQSMAPYLCVWGVALRAYVELRVAAEAPAPVSAPRPVRHVQVETVSPV